MLVTTQTASVCVRGGLALFYPPAPLPIICTHTLAGRFPLCCRAPRTACELSQINLRVRVQLTLDTLSQSDHRLWQSGRGGQAFLTGGSMGSEM